MANKNERLSRTIEYKGKIDISQILSSISTIEKQLKQTHSASVKDSSFNEVNKTIEKLKQLNKTMDEMKKKGFTNSKDFLEFQRMSEKSKELIKQIKSQLGDIKVGALADAAKAAANEVAKYDKEIKKLEASQKNILKANISDKSLKYEITEEIKRQKQQIKDAGTAEQAVNNILADQLDKRKEAAKQAKEAYEQEKLTYEQMKAAAVDLRSFKFQTTSGSTRSVSQTFLSKAMLSDTTGNGLDMNAIQAALEKSLTASNYTKGFQNFTTTLKQMGVQFKDSTINLENFKTLFNELNISLQNNNGLKAQKEKVEEANEKVKLLNQSVKQLQEMSTNGGSTQLITAIDNTNIALDRRAEAQNKANIALENSRNTDAAVAQTLQGLTTAENGYVDSLNRGTVATQDTINQQNKLDSTFDQISNRFKYLLSFMNAWHVSLRAIRQTFNDIQNIDKAFASIAMVTDMDLSDLWGQYDEYAKIANELGQSTESVIKSSALYYQQGLNTTQALTLTRDTMKLATLANIDFEQSTKLMTAALRAFHMELDEGAHITDVYSELAANAAANVQGIAYAMSKTSSIAASAGMSFENTAAMLTTMIEVTQEAPKLLKIA